MACTSAGHAGGAVFTDDAEFWRDCAHHWESSTPQGNRTALDHHILPFSS